MLPVSRPRSFTLKTPSLSLLALGSSTALLLGIASTAVHAAVHTPTQSGKRYNYHPTVSLNAAPASITSGQSTTLSWHSTNSTSATLNGASVPTSGSLTIAPSSSVTETLVVANRKASSSAQILVTVAAVAKPAPAPTPTPAPTPAPTPTPAPAPTPSPTPTPSTAADAPHINYTDLNVGSNTGGDTGNGVYVRIFGSNFGSSKNDSSLTLGGDLVTSCGLCSWTNTQIIAQLGSAASTGQIFVTVAGKASNGAPFTVTPTTIVFVSPNGNDSNTGTFASPFKTWRSAFNAVTSRDSSSPSQNTVIYLEPGISATADDGRGYNASLSLDLGGSSPTNQLSIVGYPGGTVNIGSTSVPNGAHGWGKFITLANLTIVGQSSAIDAEAGDIRIINNDLSCPAPPQGLSGTACILGETDSASDTWAFDGNNVHDTGGDVNKTYHAVYFSTGVNHADVGWNSIGQNFKGYCRSILFHATTGSNLSDLHVHDNAITGGYCDAIGFASVDPSQGTVEAYNNVISHVAIASNPYGVANEAGIAINSDPAGSTSGTVQIYNNTVVDAGGYILGHQNGCFGIVNSGATMNLTNNICSQPSNSQPYLEGSSGFTGSNNLWYGAGSPPSWDPAPVTAAPGFVSLVDLSLQASSPAKQKGSSAKTSALDILGIQRIIPSIGAFQ